MPGLFGNETYLGMKANSLQALFDMELRGPHGGHGVVVVVVEVIMVSHGGHG